MQPFQTAGEPPSLGSTPFAAIGWTRNTCQAESRIATKKGASAPRVSLLGAFEIATVLGADADPLAFVDERRDLHREPGLGHGRFPLRGGGCAFDPGGGLDDLEIDRGRKLDADGPALVPLHHHGS